MSLRNWILVVLVSVISSFATAQIMSNSSKHVAKIEPINNKSTFDRIQRTRTLRCGYFVAEILKKDVNTGQLSGPAYDIVEKMAENLKLKVDWSTETTPATVSEDLKNGRFDMLCIPIASNASRGQVMTVSKVAFFTNTSLYVHKDEARSADDLSWVNDPNVKLSGVDGTGAVTFMKQMFPKAQILSLPDMAPISDVFMQVATKKADATVMISADADGFLKSNPGAIKVGNSKIIYVSPQSFWMPHDEVKLKGMIDVALDEMLYNGSIDQILSKYEPKAGQYYLRVRPDYMIQ
ncbi:MAG: transporter substrate-binding domain-containing protein [Proteobacteria bacterium]|nr:transporter substrate-binding domain-containing protein [Pseudomonadota bacterium]